MEYPFGAISVFYSNNPFMTANDSLEEWHSQIHAVAERFTIKVCLHCILINHSWVFSTPNWLVLSITKTIDVKWAPLHGHTHFLLLNDQIGMFAVYCLLAEVESQFDFVRMHMHFLSQNKLTTNCYLWTFVNCRVDLF